MFGDGFEQSTILRTGPDGLTRVTTRSSWAKRESVLVEARGSRAGGVPARRLVGPFRERTGVRVDLSDAQTAQGEASSPFRVRRRVGTPMRDRGARGSAGGRVPPDVPVDRSSIFVDTRRPVGSTFSAGWFDQVFGAMPRPPQERSDNGNSEENQEKSQKKVRREKRKVARAGRKVIRKVRRAKRKVRRVKRRVARVKRRVVRPESSARSSPLLHPRECSSMSRPDGRSVGKGSPIGFLPFFAPSLFLVRCRDRGAS